MNSHVKADLLLVLTTLLAATGWIFSKEALSSFPPLYFIALRFAGAGLVLVLFCWRPLIHLTRTQIFAASQVGLIFGVAMVFWVLGLAYAQHLGVGAFLTSLGVVMVPLLNFALGGERPNRYVFAALPFVITGLAFLSLDELFKFGWGELCFLLSAFFLSFMFIFNTRAAAKIPTLPLTSILLILTGVVTGLVSLFTESWSLNFSSAAWGWFIASLFIATSLRFLLQTYAQSLAPPSHTALIMTLEPVWTALAAAWWFRELMTNYQFIGCSLIFSAVLVSRTPAVKAWLTNLRASRAR